MGDRATKPKNYRRGRCLAAEQERKQEAGAMVAEAGACQHPFPCLLDINVLAGLAQPCEACRPNVQRMRDMHGWTRHPAAYGQFWTSGQLTDDQQHLIECRIAQHDPRNREMPEASA